MSISKTIVISSAGTGSRLGYAHTKGLLKIGKKPLIIHQLEQLEDYDDVRVVVGFDAEKLIETVTSYRKNVTFVFNHNYLRTFTLTSLFLGSRLANDLVVSLDGDLLVSKDDMKKFLSLNYEAMGYTKAYSDEPLYTYIEKKNDKEYITGFSRKKITYEWTGLLQIKRKSIKDGKHVYHLVDDLLPFRAEYINSCYEIDTPNDYKRAIIWAKKYL